MQANMALPIETFAKLLIASLVLKGKTSFRPHDKDDQHSAIQLYKYINELADQHKPAEGTARSRLFKDLIRIRNKVAPTFTGTFDNFESLLRDQQYWLTSSRNPTYEAISFDLDPSVARQILKDVDGGLAELIDQASMVYLGERRAPTSPTSPKEA